MLVAESLDMTSVFTIDLRAFSNLFGKILVPMKLGKKQLNFGGKMAQFGKNGTILGKKMYNFSQIGKAYLLNLDFSANWVCFSLIGNFYRQLGKKLVQKTRPSFV